MFKIRFASLVGKFTITHVQEFATKVEALAAITAHATAAGYTNVKEVMDDMDSIRFTARTPRGRGGRNIAFCDFTY
jgi:hypothetical protein